MAEKTFKGLIDRAKRRDSYWVGKAISDFTDDLYSLMETRGVNKAELARRIGSSPAYITKVLRGNNNFTIESMVRLVRALDGQLCIHVGRAEDQVRWFDVVAKRGHHAAAPQAGFRRISETHYQKQTPSETFDNESDPAVA